MSRSRLITQCVADIPPEEIQWLWPGRIPMGAVSLLVGHPGEGKSGLALEVAAILSRGGTWPDSLGPPVEPGTALVLSAEDNQDAVADRLKAAGADSSHIYIVEDCDEGVLPYLQEKIDQVAGTRLATKLVIIDPIASYLPRGDYPELIALLPDFAERNRVAVLLTAHLNKGESEKAIHRLAGPIGLASAPRMIWSVARDPADRARRVLSLEKKSLRGQAATSLSYGYKDGRHDWGRSTVVSRGVVCQSCGRPIALLHFDQQAIPLEAEAGVYGPEVRVVRHQCRSKETTTAAPLRPETKRAPGRRGPRPLKLAIAMEWCAEQLAKGPIAQSELILLAKGRGIKRATLANALKGIGVTRASDEQGRIILRSGSDGPVPPGAPSVERAARDAKSRFEGRKAKILEALSGTFPSGLSFTEIRRGVFASRIPSEQLRTVLTVLRDGGLVRSHAAESGGRYQSVWTLTEKPSTS